MCECDQINLNTAFDKITVLENKENWNKQYDTIGYGLYVNWFVYVCLSYLTLLFCRFMAN